MSFALDSVKFKGVESTAFASNATGLKEKSTESCTDK